MKSHGGRVAFVAALAGLDPLGFCFVLWLHIPHSLSLEYTQLRSSHVIISSHTGYRTRSEGKVDKDAPRTNDHKPNWY